jgi:hypothetical protein
MLLGLLKVQTAFGRFRFWILEFCPEKKKRETKKKSVILIDIPSNNRPLALILTLETIMASFYCKI